jgi:hypothetical protein
LAPLFSALSKIDTAELPKQPMLLGMTAEILSPEEFASLILIGNAPVHGSPPVIPAAHSTRLIVLGYMADLDGRLRMTTTGRMRVYAGQLDSELR